MCEGCYIEAGRPTPTQEARALRPLIARVYEYSAVGGNAHVVLDDWNIEDNHIDWCLTTGIDTNIHQAGASDIAAERACLEAMKALSLDQRAAALAVYEGFAT